MNDLKKENDRLQGALKFYAKRGNWRWWWWKCLPRRPRASARDKGKLARLVLSQVAKVE